MSGKAFDARAEQTRSKRMDGGRENGYLENTENGMLKYWSNIFAMLGVALIATAFFRPDDWQAGCISGAVTIFIGAWFHGLSTPTTGGKK